MVASLQSHNSQLKQTTKQQQMTIAQLEVQLLGFHLCRCDTVNVQTFALQSVLQLCAVPWSHSIAGCHASANGLNLQLSVPRGISVPSGNLLSYYPVRGGCDAASASACDEDRVSL